MPLQWLSVKQTSKHTHTKKTWQWLENGPFRQINYGYSPVSSPKNTQKQNILMIPSLLLHNHPCLPLQNWEISLLLSVCHVTPSIFPKCSLEIKQQKSFAIIYCSKTRSVDLYIASSVQLCPSSDSSWWMEELGAPQPLPQQVLCQDREQERQLVA